MPSSSSASPDKSSSSTSASSEESSSSTTTSSDNNSTESVVAEAYRRQYLFTWSHTDREDLQCPGNWAKEAFGELAMRLMREHFRRAHAGRGRPNRVLKAAVFDEYHKEGAAQGKQHKHLAVLADKPFAFRPIEAALLSEGIAVHTSATHNYYWTTILYLSVPNEEAGGKSEQDLDHDPWLSPGHPPVKEELMQIPPGAYRADKVRVKKFLGIASDKQDPWQKGFFTFLEKENVSTPLEVFAVAEREKCAGRPALANWCALNAHKVPQMIANAMAVRGATERLACSKATLLEKLHAAAHELPCRCEGRWQAGARRVLENNGICEAEYTAVIRKALSMGACRGVHVGLIGIGGAGKSMLLESWELIFNAAAKPQKGSSFPLSALIEAELIVWQDYGHDERTVAFTDLLSILVGETVNIRVPATGGCSGSVKHKSCAPMFYSGRG